MTNLDPPTPWRCSEPGCKQQGYHRQPHRDSDGHPTFNPAAPLRCYTHRHDAPNPDARYPLPGHQAFGGCCS